MIRAALPCCWQRNAPPGPVNLPFGGGITEGEPCRSGNSQLPFALTLRIVDEPCRLRKDSLPPREGGEWVEREHKRKVKVAALPEWKQKAAALHRCGVGSCSCRRAVDESCRAESDGEPCRSGNSHLQSADAATRGAPQAIQVADRFHVLRNVGDALETFLLHKRAHLKDAAVAAADALTPPPVAPVAVEEAYPGTHTSTAQLWRQRAEEESLRKHERHGVAYEAVRDLRGKWTRPHDTILLVKAADGFTRPARRRQTDAYVRAGSPSTNRPDDRD